MRARETKKCPGCHRTIPAAWPGKCVMCMVAGPERNQRRPQETRLFGFGVKLRAKVGR